MTMDRTNCDFGKTAINILMVSAIWNGIGIPPIWTLLPSAGELLALACSGNPRRALDQPA